MRIDGNWLLCDDGIVRPIFRGRVQAKDEDWALVSFLADVGADRTVLNAEALEKLGLSAKIAAEQLAGVGGKTNTVVVDTKIQLAQQNGAMATFAGQFAAFTDPAALDMSVLGRDITNLFALIVDRQQELVCMIGRGHRYTISVG